MKKWLLLIFWIGLCELVGLFATPFTIVAISTWYTTLIKPSFSPPNWLFGPVWILLYFLMGVAAYLVWEKGWKRKPVRTALNFFFIQLVLNFLWSVLFFGLHSPILGLMDIILLLVFIVMTIWQFKKISPTAAYLLIPYLLWVSFATLLNFSIVVLN